VTLPAPVNHLIRQLIRTHFCSSAPFRSYLKKSLCYVFALSTFSLSLSLSPFSVPLLYLTTRSVSVASDFVCRSRSYRSFGSRFKSSSHLSYDLGFFMSFSDAPFNLDIEKQVLLLNYIFSVPTLVYLLNILAGGWGSSLRPSRLLSAVSTFAQKLSHVALLPRFVRILFHFEFVLIGIFIYLFCNFIIF
jgi:hypothetical protein